MNRRRQSRGKMLLLVALVIVLICGVFLIGIVFSTLLSQHSRAQYNVDALALSMAKILNEGDRVGQMNQMVARNRELVFLTREMSDDCQRVGLGHLAALSEQLVEESYAANQLIDSERMNQIENVSQQIRKMSREYNDHRGQKSNSIFPWLQTFEPEITRVDVGCVKNVQSSVKSSLVEELADWDRKQRYVQPVSNLFFANSNAKLPSPDDALDFKFSALPAFIDNTCAPPRVANPDVFEPYPIVIRDPKTGARPNDKIPYAVRLNTTMDVALDADELSRHSVQVTSIGVAGGAISDYE